ncbi:MAG: lysine biosynthesis protein LysW [Bdellovibrionales bacterium]|nr:lysine biosynthesis protein LysW [Bdellovibrionales bacterium]
MANDPNGNAAAKKLTAVSPITGAIVELPANVEVGELIDDPESGDELEVVSLDPITLQPAPQEEEDWGE